MTPAHARVMAEYNRWMNERLYALCAEMPDAERKRDRGAFFGSIHRTLNHLIYADSAFLARFKGEAPPYTRPDQEIHADFGTLREARVALDGALLAWVGTLDAGWLLAPVTYRSFVDGALRTLPAWVLVTHLFNHQTHHRGQITTLLSQAGLDPGVTDLPWLPGLTGFAASGAGGGADSAGKRPDVG